MPKRFRLTRRYNAAMTEDGYRRLRKFAQEAGLDEGEALSFLFENFDSKAHHRRMAAARRALAQGGHDGSQGRCQDRDGSTYRTWRMPPAGVFRER
jgi:hypothetical protein